MTKRHLTDLIESYLSRRQWLQGAAAATAVAASSSSTVAALQQPADDSANPVIGTGSTSSLEFEEIEHAIDETIHVAEGFETQVVARWGDPLTKDAPAFDPAHLTAESQSKQFGYNCDFVAYLPLPRGSKNSDHGLLCVNNEYTNAELMFKGIEHETKSETMNREQSLAEMAAQGHSVVEIKKVDGKWQHVIGKYNRRITALSTRMNLAGPAAGDDRMKTTDCPDGRQCTGTFNNCAGGVTPWGTVLIAEENFHSYFGGDVEKHPDRENMKRYGVGTSEYAWYRFLRRFNIDLEPNSPNLYGWIVEYDPYDPKSTPVKRTALGRIRHEGATTALTADGRLVVYSGDDQENQCFYRFVSAKKCDPADPANNRELLDDGVLSVAKYHESGKLEWLPLVFGQGKLTEENGFQSQADVLIETRKAAMLLGATPMDRPEDAETNPVTGKVYLMLTNNSTRKPEEVDAANPRPKNIHGHIVEMIPPISKSGNGKSVLDHGADHFEWKVFLRAGDPELKEVGADYHEQVSRHGWLSCPDNCTFDSRGRIWIATDGARDQQIGDAIYACDTEGGGRALTRQFFRGCHGAEICGPCFTPDDSTMFVAIQHPGDGSQFSDPSTRWPDFKDGVPPRPSVVAITKKGGGPIG